MRWPARLDAQRVDGLPTRPGLSRSDAVPDGTVTSSQASDALCLDPDQKANAALPRVRAGVDTEQETAMTTTRKTPATSVGPTLAATLLALAPPAGATIEVIVATSGSRADVGIANDQIGFMYHFDVSPDGRWWAGHFELDDALDSLHLRGQGTRTPEVVWVEGQNSPGGLPGTLRAVAEDRQVSINDTGAMAGLARVQLSGVNQGQFVYHYDGVALNVVAETAQPIAAVADASFGFDFQSPNIDEFNVVSFYADNISGPGITAANDALTLTANGSAPAGQRKGVSSYAGDVLTRIDPGQFVVSRDGSRFVFAGDTVASTSTDDLIVVGDIGTPGDAVIQEGVTAVTTAAGADVFDVASKVVFGGDNWFAAGDTVGGAGVVLRNGTVIASEGGVAPDGFNYVGDPLAIAADEQGNIVWAWRTSNPDPERDMLLVYNGDTTLVVENDTFFYDADADGESEEIRIDRLFEDFTDLSLAGGHAYFMTELDTPVSTVFVGYGFLRIPVDTDSDGDGVTDNSDNCIDIPNADQRDSNGDGFGNVCDADLNNDGIINVLDLGLLRSVFFSADEDADFNGDGVVNVVDLGVLRSTFFGMPGPSGLQ